MEFQDRNDAGRQLAARFASLNMSADIIIGIPRGGVVIAAEMAADLGAALDVVLVRKIGADYNPECAVGAVAESGDRIVDDAAISDLGLDREKIEQASQSLIGEMREQSIALRRKFPRLELRGKNVVVADDGVATGLTLVAAARMLRREAPSRLLLAVPTGAADSLRELRDCFDQIVCLDEVNLFFSVGEHYHDFTPVSDETVAELLRRNRGELHGEGRSI